MDRREYVPTFTAFAQPLIARPIDPNTSNADTYVVGFRVKTGEVVFISTEMEELPASQVLLTALPDSFKPYS
jgi:hypothetical protein